MFVVLLVVAIVGAAVGGAVLAYQVVHAPVRRLGADLDALAESAPGTRLDPARYGTAPLAAVAARVNQVLSAQQAADAAAREAADRARDGEERGAQVARQLDPVLAAIRAETDALRRLSLETGAQVRLEALVRATREAHDLVRGVLTVADRDRLPGAKADLGDAVRQAVRTLRDQGLTRGAALTADLDERPCLVPILPEDAERLAMAVIGTAIADGGDRPHIGVVVLRIPRVLLEEGQVRRSSDPALTIVPRRPNPRLDKWLRSGRATAEVIKLIVAGSGQGIPADVERRFYDPAAERDGANVALAIGRRLIERAGGTVWVQPAREGGAAFHVVLPFAGHVAPVPPPSGELILGAMP